MDSWALEVFLVRGIWRLTIDCWLSALLQGHGDSANLPKSGRKLYSFNLAKNARLIPQVALSMISSSCSHYFGRSANHFAVNR